jgi:hypothetical protein
MTYSEPSPTLRAIWRDLEERERPCGLCGERRHKPYCVHSNDMQAKLRRWLLEREEPAT